MLNNIMKFVLSSAELQATLGLFVAVATIMLITTAVAISAAIIIDKKKA
jgi:hypothetical protein